MKSHHSFGKEVLSEHISALSDTTHCLCVPDNEKTLLFLLKNVVASLQDDHPKSTPLVFRPCRVPLHIECELACVTCRTWRAWWHVISKAGPRGTASTLTSQIACLGGGWLHLGRTLTKPCGQSICKETNSQRQLARMEVSHITSGFYSPSQAVVECHIAGDVLLQPQERIQAGTTLTLLLPHYTHPLTLPSNPWVRGARRDHK